MTTKLPWTLFLLSFLPLTAASGAVVEYASGHGDIGLAYEDSELELHYHFGDGAVLDGSPLVGELEYGPSEAYVRVGDNAKVTTTADVSFLGTSMGDSVWLLPQSNTAGLPFLGIAAEELDATFSGAVLSMSSFSGPGEFALWQAGGIGGTNVRWQSSNGIDNTDMLNLGIGGHDHYNYGFTAEGVYDVGVTAVADFAAGGSVTDFGTFRFVVGSATAVPEPGSLVVLAAAGIAAMVPRRRRRAVS
ncbi:MAG: choice-of-anchor M domain-containing protein [Rubripirellula sp.]